VLTACRFARLDSPPSIPAALLIGYPTGHQPAALQLLTHERRLRLTPLVGPLSRRLRPINRMTPPTI
jgi:hypothetical protein